MEWIEPWQLIDFEKQELFNNELQKEVHSAHILFNTQLNAIAKSSINDDILYAFTDGTMRVAEVHLTWKQSVEIFRYPVSIIYCSFEKWKNVVLYENILPLIDYSSTVCVLGYFLIDQLEYSDYFKWAECLIEQNTSSPKIDILLSYSLDTDIQPIEFLHFIKSFFQELGFDPNNLERSLRQFMAYLCDRIILNVEELDNVIQLFNKLDQKYNEKFDYFSEWRCFGIDLYNIYTYEPPIYFNDLTLMNYQTFVIKFVEAFKAKIMILQSNEF